MPAKSHFERLVELRLVELGTALRNTPDADHLKMVAIKNKMAGLDMAMSLYRDAARADIDPDDIP